MLSSFVDRVTGSHEFAVVKWLAKLYGVLVLIGVDFGARVHGYRGPSDLVTLETHRLDSRTGRITESDFEELTDEMMFGAGTDVRPEPVVPEMARPPVFVRPTGSPLRFPAIRP